MKTPKTVINLELENSCETISIRKWNNYMEDTTKANGARIRNLIKNHLPDLYASLALNFYNPYEKNCVKKKGLFVYVHSAIEYFIKYN